MSTPPQREERVIRSWMFGRDDELEFLPRVGGNDVRLVTRAREGEDVAVSRGVDDDLGQDGLAPGLALEDHAPDLVALLDRRHHPGVEQQGDARAPGPDPATPS